MAEEFLGSLSPGQRRTLVGRLFEKGFEYEFVGVNYGHIRVGNALPEHPRERDGEGDAIAVGFVSPDSLILTNVDCKFPENYHGRIRDLYSQIVSGQFVQRVQLVA